MSITDYALDIALVAIVLLQIRGRRLTVASLLLPFAIVGWVAFTYLKGVPTSGNDLLLVGACAAVGALLGGLCAVFTSVKSDSAGIPFVKAGAIAAALWIVGVGARFAFQVYATHGGGEAIGRFSVAHDITSAQAWTAALILMALAEVAFRQGILAFRAFVLQPRSHPAARELSLSPSVSSIMESGDGAY